MPYDETDEEYLRRRPARRAFARFREAWPIYFQGAPSDHTLAHRLDATFHAGWAAAAETTVNALQGYPEPAMRKPIHVLFVTNSATERCGVRIYGELWMDALRRAGVEITEWDGTYQSILARGGAYLPVRLDRFDLIHFNWDPQAINHYLPEHFPAEIPLSVFLHDVPPNSTCPVAGRANLLMAHEPGEGITVIDHAVPTYRSLVGVAPGVIRVGTSGIRDDPGVALVEAVCKQEGWVHSRAGSKGRWLTTAEEIDRLAANTVNVCWYQTSGRGKSMAAMFMVAAERPVVLSGSTMFSNLWPYATELLLWAHTHDDQHQPTADYQDLAILRDLITCAAGAPVNPWKAGVGLSWARRAGEIKGLWEGVVGGR